MADGSRGGAGLVPRSSRPLKRTKLVADLWCGAGGTLTGAARAAREMGIALEAVSVNHWPTAISTHERNYPGFRHHCADLESARPIELVPEGYLDALLASPTCTFYSRARGGKPVNDQQRMDPWHIVRWCTELRVKSLLVENVSEIQNWGPCNLVTGKPIESRKGEYFKAWISALRAIGFHVEYRVLNCADYGDATTRKRFFLRGRSDGKPIIWPEPTHARQASTDLLSNKKKWRGAREIIDWNTPGKSIFTRKKPLAPNTLRRIRAGAVRYSWPQPYVDAIDALLEGREPVLDIRFEDRVGELAPSIAVGDPSMLMHLRGTTDAHIQVSAKPVDEPAPTLTAGGQHLGIVMAVGSGGAARDLGEPIPTLTTGGNGASPHYVTPLLMGVNGTALAKDVAEPVPTITTGGASSVNRPGNARPQLIEPIIVSRNGFENRGAQSVERPMPTATTRGAGYLADPVLAPYYGGGSGLTSQTVEAPVPAVTTKGRFGLADPVVIRTDQTGSGATGVRSIDDPVHTLVTKGNVGIGQPFLVPNFGEREGQESRTHDLDAPMPTVTASGHIQLAQPTIRSYRIDILYRMLHFRELARATSFDDGDEIYDFAGNSTEITKQIGNAVPVRTAKALFGAMMME